MRLLSLATDFMCQLHLAAYTLTIPSKGPHMSNPRYTPTEKPAISDAEYAQLDAVATIPGALCGAIRPGTLGYQQCWRIASHEGAHVSQDDQAWMTPAPA